MPNDLAIFHDPVLLADHFSNGWVELLANNRDRFPLPTQSEIDNWAITDHQLNSCAQEFIILAAVGVTVTVMKNRPFEYYSAFISALAGRLSSVIFGHCSIKGRDEFVKVIEKYMDDLETSMVEFSYTYTERAFPGNENKVSIIMAHLWKRAFDICMEAMSTSREFFVACMAEEQLQNARDK